MPGFPKIIVETSPSCNLRQGLQWLLEEIKPVHSDLEAALGIPTSIGLRRDGYSQFPHSDIAKAKSSLFAAFRAARIPLVGRPGKGKMYIDSDCEHSIRFEYYGNARKISVSEITEAGLDGFDFELNTLYHITEYDDHFVPLAGWEYVDLVMPSEKMFRNYPPRINDLDELEELPPIDLTGMADTRRERLVSLGAETGVDVVPIARTKLLNPRENRIVPENVTTGNRENSNKSRVALPPYLKFAVFVFERLGPDTIANLKKDDLQATIKELWWETLGPSSEALVAYMAMMLRLPEAKRGGAKAQKKSGP
jgi:hypothetical protein